MKHYKRLEWASILGGGVVFAIAAVILHVFGLPEAGSFILAGILALVPAVYLVSIAMLSRAYYAWGKDTAATPTEAWRGLVRWYWSAVGIGIFILANLIGAVAIVRVGDWGVFWGIPIGMVIGGLLAWRQEMRQRPKDPESLNTVYAKIEAVKRDIDREDRETLEAAERILKREQARMHTGALSL